MEDHLGGTGQKMKWNISPLKVKDYSAFISTPGDKWNAIDRSCDLDTFRSRLHSSPYVNPDNTKWPTKADEPSGASLLVPNSKEINELLNINSGSTESGSSRILDGSDSGVVLQQTKASDNIAINAANFSLDSGMQATQGSPEKLEPSRCSEKGVISFSGVFDPMATPFKPRTTNSSFSASHPLQRSHVKAIDIANSISSAHYSKPVALNDIKNSFSNFSGLTNTFAREHGVNPRFEAMGQFDPCRFSLHSSCQNDSLPNLNMTTAIDPPFAARKFNKESSSNVLQNEVLEEKETFRDYNIRLEDAYGTPLCKLEGSGESKSGDSYLLAGLSKGKIADSTSEGNTKQECEQKVTFEDLVQASIKAIREKNACLGNSLQASKLENFRKAVQLQPETNRSSVNLAFMTSRNLPGEVTEYRPSKYRTEPCTTYHTIGVCPYGKRCNFYHEIGEKNDAPSVSKETRFKTRLCKTWQKAGECPYELRCDFAHGTNDLAPNSPYRPHYKTRMCRVLQQTGRCPYGPQCTFAHKQCELRTDISLIYKYKTEICKSWAFGLKCSHGADCHFAHGVDELKTAKARLLDF